ncbi:uroporphyrinogen-III synthase/uroporphyrinogen III methyltransferase/synthase [Psychromicrobium silvestre]|uniref:Uroporphyrinogen-III synthase/uroporphyrinogen III methyltransferase/synthase n=1 Tax=Psychromicrobium silvestre TaxID=1645614 RepID=A0A7Y9S7C9_9MICC|nr:uroporphyrinogen-III synthase [Psychromicrobium silvestre]NYE95031.1 uroporphyrinogen-III synthase/uroporphyrinogen III methyltransferase/synthase [Psychromicrobium silvestre]
MATEEAAERGALAGKSVLITRSPDRAGAFLSALQEAGAVPYLLPLIDFETVEFSVEALGAGEYGWLVVSSITTVRALKYQASKSGISLSELIPSGTKIATIGPSSRRVLEREGLRVDLAPEDIQSAEGLIAVLPDLSGLRAWLPQSDLATPRLAEGLLAAGASVDAVVVYRTVDYPAAEGSRLTTPLEIGVEPQEHFEAQLLEPEQARRLIAEGALDAVVAASPSAASRIKATLAPLGGMKFIAIGKPTAQQASVEGLKVAAVAATPSPEGIVEALCSSFNPDIPTVPLGPSGGSSGALLEGPNHELF